jgi:hypothetical protein
MWPDWKKYSFQLTGYTERVCIDCQMLKKTKKSVNLYVITPISATPISAYFIKTSIVFYKSKSAVNITTLQKNKSTIKYNVR